VNGITLGTLATLVGGKLQGDPELLLQGADTIRDARPGQITLADKPELTDKLNACAASAAVVHSKVTDCNKPAIVVDNVHQAFALIVTQFRPLTNWGAQGVLPGSQVATSAIVGEGSTVMPNATLGEYVIIGKRCIIHAGVSIMAGSILGDDVTVFPNAVLYPHTEVGNRCIIHATATLGAYGFGYQTKNGQHILSAQLGNVVLEDDVEIGAGTTIDRGTYGSTRICRGSKLDNQVHIGHNCRIGNHNLICSQVGIAGSCSTGDYVVMAGQVGIGDHCDITDKVILVAKSGVMRDITDAGTYSGVPITPAREQLQIWSILPKLPEMKKELKQLRKQLDQITAEANGTEASRDDHDKRQAAA
jgi:UDP-3-O-[3-hydroxymyristoyl] glucosamine N-acyltransferase